MENNVTFISFREGDHHDPPLDLPLGRPALNISKVINLSFLCGAPWLKVYNKHSQYIKGHLLDKILLKRCFLLKRLRTTALV